ncbi:hypothetical protein PMI12_05356, partial [Variovorax sp. CF313]
MKALASIRMLRVSGCAHADG